LHEASTIDAQVELSAVVIAYNEVECIVQVVSELHQALTRAGLSFELVLVDDGSQDATPARMHELAAIQQHVRVVALTPNRGIGAALRAGFDAARGRFVTWIPADGQIAPQVVLDLYAQRGRGRMLTTVYRSRADAWYRHVISSSLNEIIRWRTGQAAKSGGNYLFERDLWQQYQPPADDSMMLSSAFRQRVRQAGVPIVEVDIDARSRVAGRSKVLNPRTILRTLAAALKQRH
jgi:glycosyltransferase involved in cell wall biosynthesis